MRNRIGRFELPAVLIVWWATTLVMLKAASAETPTEIRPGPRAKMVIVAPASLGEALTPYIEYRRQALSVEFAELETILTQTEGKDDPEKLKRFLYSRWQQQIGYVLLVGDADLLPVRYMVLDRITPAACDIAFYPSDLYYADVAKADGTFDDWNACRDGFHAHYFGEVHGEKNKSDAINLDQIDYRPELAVGRWPVASGQEVAIVASKTIAFERGFASDPNRARRAGFLCNAGWVDSRRLLDRAASKMPDGWQIEKRYYADAAGPSTPPPTEEEVLKLLNGGIDLLVHTGHGTDTSWNECLFLQRLDRLKNADRPAVMMSAGCSTARFATLPPYEAYVDVSGAEHKGTDAGEVFTAPPPPPAPYQKGRFNPPGLGEQLLRAGANGAVAYIGCNTGSQPCGLTLVEGLTKAWGESPEPRLGDCWKSAIRFYYERQDLATLKPNADWYPPSIFFQGMKFMLFGDPALRLPR